MSTRGQQMVEVALRQSKSKKRKFVQSKLTLTNPHKKRKKLQIYPAQNNNTQSENAYQLPCRKKQKLHTHNYNSSSASTDTVLRTLKQRFGFNSFRSSQRNAIDSILHKRDVLLLMPTGGGKSLCFQVPALVLNKVSIVLSPLIALMKNHCDSLNRKGINAKIINSTISEKEKREIFESLEGKRSGKNIEILYTTPEQIKSNQRFVNILNKLYKNHSIGLFAIDECHCISSWGHDFRPSYRNLSILRRQYPNIPIIALTATATNNVRNDVIKSLQLHNPTVISSGFDRPNLYFSFKYIENIKPVKTWVAKAKKGKGRKKRYRRKINKTEITKGNQKVCDDIHRFIKRYKYQNECGLIYIFSRKDAETMAYYLKKEYKLSIAAYHAGMGTKKKTDIQENWERHRTNIIVCTCAFGMGIDVKNVRFVIHCTINKNLESYYQEIGRAGRDQRFSRILCYYSVNMLKKHQNILLRETIGKIDYRRKRGKSKPEIKRMATNDALYVQSVKNIESVQQFAEPNRCRRQILLNYFGQTNSAKCEWNNQNQRRNCCDFCDDAKRIRDIKVKYGKMRQGKENVCDMNVDDSEMDFFDPIQAFEETHNPMFSNFNNNRVKPESNDLNEAISHSQVLLNGERTSEIKGLKIETRENGLFEFLGVIEDNIKGRNDSDSLNVFEIAKEKELKVFETANTSFVYGFNLRLEMESIRKRTQNGQLWNGTNVGITLPNINAKHEMIVSNLNKEGINELLNAFKIEREWMISMLERRNDGLDTFVRWKTNLSNTYRANVTELCTKYKSELECISELNGINDRLSEERELLSSVIGGYNPNERQQSECWNSDYRRVLDALQTCDALENKRVEIIKQFDGSHRKGKGKEEAEAEDSDDDLLILSLNMKHKNVQCLVSMGFDSEIIKRVWSVLKNDNETKQITANDAGFVVKMIDKIQQNEQIGP